VGFDALIQTYAHALAEIRHIVVAETQDEERPYEDSKQEEKAAG
jgi:hypothetical protein